MNWLRVKNWEKFQHYKKRRPPWIKLYPAVLEDFAFRSLSDASKLLAICSWMLASKDGGYIPDQLGYLNGLAGINANQDDLEALVAQGFLVRCQRHASKTLATRKQSAIPETETEAEREREVPIKSLRSQQGRGGSATAVERIVGDALNSMLPPGRQQHRHPAA